MAITETLFASSPTIEPAVIDSAARDNTPPLTDFTQRDPISINLKSGQGGIRTLGDVAATPAFQASPFDRSGTCPLLNSRKVDIQEAHK